MNLDVFKQKRDAIHSTYTYISSTNENNIWTWWHCFYIYYNIWYKPVKKNNKFVNYTKIGPKTVCISLRNLKMYSLYIFNYFKKACCWSKNITYDIFCSQLRFQNTNEKSRIKTKKSTLTFKDKYIKKNVNYFSIIF